MSWGIDGKKLVQGVWKEGNPLKEIKEKRRIGYSEDGNNNQFRVTLAENITNVKPQYPVLVEPKLDGYRLIVTKDGLFTKNSSGSLGNRLTLIRLEKQLMFLRKLVSKYLKTEVLLDGELYNHEIGFNGITKIAKFNFDKNPVDEKWIRDKNYADAFAEFHWFDIVVDGYSLLERVGIRNKIYNNVSSKIPNVKSVSSYIVNNKEELDILFSNFVLKGYEGVMIKDTKSFYVQGRSKSLIKYKPVQDMEVKIIDILEGKGLRKGTAGRIIYEYNFNNKVYKGESDCKELNHNELKEIYENKDLYIGSYVTVYYQNVSEKGLRFAKVSGKSIKSIRDLDNS